MKSKGKSVEKPCSIMLGGRELKYILKRSGRKSVGISIDRTGLVKVAGPYGVPENYIRQVILKKASWILEKLRQLENRAVSCNTPKSMVPGEQFRFLGREYTLMLEEKAGLKKSTVRLEGENIVLSHNGTFDSEKLRDSLKLWYVAQFKQTVENCVPGYASVLKVQPHKITVKEQKTRWGSCSSKGNINLNWKLIMARPDVLEYVVVHELCHMREMNHSARFWKLVESIFPGYKECRAWLKQNGGLLTIE